MAETAAGVRAGRAMRVAAGTESETGDDALGAVVAEATAGAATLPTAAAAHNVSALEARKVLRGLRCDGKSSSFLFDRLPG
jgi:hypothetical protein